MEVMSEMLMNASKKYIELKGNLRVIAGRHNQSRQIPTIAIIVAILLTLGISYTYFTLPGVNADATDANSACSWYMIRKNDNLTLIARHYHTTASHLAIANHIRNINFIVMGRAICIPHKTTHKNSCAYNGIASNGNICWFAYSGLEHSTRSQVAAQLRQAAYKQGIPASLVMAIGWQESGWTQHIIAHDGGIGVMQIMPYTAASLNCMAGASMNPYRTHDNIDLGAYYLRMLWTTFHGNLAKTISAYNEGSWNVEHRGIFNWQYVNSVMAIMQRMN